MQPKGAGCPRRPPTSAPAASARPARSKTSGCWARIKQVHKQNFAAYGDQRVWKQLRREGDFVPRCQVQRLMRAQASRAPSAAASRDAQRSRATHQLGPTSSSALHRHGAEQVVGRRLHLPLLGRRRVLRVRHRRVQPPRRRLAVRLTHAHRPRPRRPAHGPGPARPRRRHRPGPSQRPRQTRPPSDPVRLNGPRWEIQATFPGETDLLPSSSPTCAVRARYP